MRALLIALMVALLTVPASAQISAGRGRGGGEQKSAEEPAHKQSDKEYNAALSRMPDGKYDPWKTVRGQTNTAPSTAPASAR